MSSMDFIRNIIILGEATEFNQAVAANLKEASDKLNIISLADKNLVSQTLSEKKVSLVLMNLKEVQDCKYIFRLLGMYKMKTNDKLSILFTSENFDTFQEIINKTELDGVDVIPWPVTADDMADKIHHLIFDKQITKTVVKKKGNKLDIDLEFIQVFIQSTRNVLAEMGQVENLVHGKPTFKDKMTDPIEAGIASRIMISSKFFTGSFYVIFPEKSFLNLYANAVFEECDSINEENRDFAGELANIIYGHSKKVFSANGLNLDMAIPSIHPSSNIESELVVVIPFDSSIGNFYIAVAPGNL